MLNASGVSVSSTTPIGLDKSSSFVSERERATNVLHKKPNVCLPTDLSKAIGQGFFPLKLTQTSCMMRKDILIPTRKACQTEHQLAASTWLGYCSDRKRKLSTNPWLPITSSPRIVFSSALRLSWISLDSLAVQLTCCRITGEV